MISIIVAYSKSNRIIGKDGKIPWVLPEDINHFKEVTEGHVVIMGRKTWESLPERFRPLPNRVNLVLSKTLKINDKQENYVCYSLTEALCYCNSYFRRKRVFIIGGQSVYAQALETNVVDEVIASEIHETYDGDTYFPSLRGHWESEVIRLSEEFNIVKYQKVSK